MERCKTNTSLSKENKEILNHVPEEKRSMAKEIMKRLVFMKSVLNDLEHEIREHGVVDDFQNGKQHFLKESPAVKSYNQTIQRYGNLYKQLENMLPKEDKNAASEALMNFIEQE